MKTDKGKRLYKGFLEVAHESVVDYFSQWTFDDPIIISAETDEKFQRIQRLMYKAICYFSNNYEKFKQVIPISEEAEKILSLCKNKTYVPGSYRTDFILDKNNEIKLIEITCRFALNGIFVSGFYNLLTDKYLFETPNITKTDRYTPVFDYLMNLWGNFDHICFLKGRFNNNESKYAIPILEKAGFKVHAIEADAIPQNTDLFENAVLISELNQEDWFNLSEDVLKKIIDSNLFNDPRTIFLIHDKRFFSIFHNDDFLDAVFSKEEKKEMCQYIVPTFRPDERPELWIDARKNKKNWIVKPFANGRSINVFAGCCTSDEDWENLFLSGEIGNMVLQPYINQRQYKGTVKGKPYEDYATGLLLFYNNNYFGSGIFRTSSFPVTNKVDDRKMIPIVTDDIVNSEKYIII